MFVCIANKLFRNKLFTKWFHRFQTVIACYKWTSHFQTLRTLSTLLKNVTSETYEHGLLCICFCDFHLWFGFTDTVRISLVPVKFSCKLWFEGRYHFTITPHADTYAKGWLLCMGYVCYVSSLLKCTPIEIFIDFLAKLSSDCVICLRNVNQVMWKGHTIFKQTE